MSQAEVSSDQARIYDQGYKPFRGTLASVNTRFIAITRNEFRQVWKNKWFRRMMWISYFPVIIAIIGSIIKNKISIFGQQIDASAEIGNICIVCELWDVGLFWAMIAVVMAGRKAIGEDLRTGALTVFFSRPISIAQYLLGKWLAICAAIAMVTFVPGVVFIISGLLIGTSTLIETLLLIFAMLLLSVITYTCFGWVMIGISSIAGRGRAAGIVWVLVYTFTSGIGESIAEVTGRAYFRAMGLPSASSKVAEAFLGNGPFDELAAINVAGLLLWAALGILVVLFRLRRWMRT